MKTFDGFKNVYAEWKKLKSFGVLSILNLNHQEIDTLIGTGVIK